MELRVLLLVCMLSAALAGSGILSHRRRGALVGLRGGGPLDDILYGPKGKRAGDGEIGLSMTAQGAAGSEEEENDWADEDDLPKDIDMGQLMVGVGQTVVVGGEAYDKVLGIPHINNTLSRVNPRRRRLQALHVARGPSLVC